MKVLLRIKRKKLTILKMQPKRLAKYQKTITEHLLQKNLNLELRLKVGDNELGEETKEKIKLEEELFEAKKVLNKSSSVLASPPAVDKNSADIDKSAESKNSATENLDETVCTICATPIVDYVQKYFLGEAFKPACDKCDDKSWVSDENCSETETNVEDAKLPDLPPAHVDCCLNDIEEKFEESLRNFRGEENAPKYETLALEVVKSNEITLDVSIADIRIHNNSLMDLINGMDYKVIFRHLCRTLLRFVKSKDPDLSSKKLLVRLVP